MRVLLPGKPVLQPHQGEAKLPQTLPATSFKSQEDDSDTEDGFCELTTLCESGV